MELTPRDIQDKQFHDAFRGYSHEEVDSFLDEVAQAFERMYRDYATLEQRVAELEERSGDNRVAEEMLRKTIYSAQRTATEAVEEARAAASRLLAEAEEKARDLTVVAEASARDALAAAETHAGEAVAAAEARARDIVARAVATERQLEVRIRSLRMFEQGYRAQLAELLEEQVRLLAETSTVAPPDVAVVPPLPPEAGAESFTAGAGRLTSTPEDAAGNAETPEGPEPEGSEKEHPKDPHAVQDDVQDEATPPRGDRRRMPSAHLERAEAEPRAEPGPDTVVVTWARDEPVPGEPAPPPLRDAAGSAPDSAESVTPAESVDAGESALLRVVSGPGRVRSAPQAPASRPEPAGPPPGPTRRQDTRPSARGDGLDEEEHRSISRLFWGGDE